MDNDIINSNSWSVKKVRDKFWKQFKHTFMYLAIREYSISGNYPTTRKEIVERLSSSEVKETFEVLHSIDNFSEKKIVNSARSLVNYLEKLNP